MFEKIRKMKNQKGFTLVELIVVLVILAILAAMLVPALTGYIDKANNQKIVATTRQVVMAAQTEVSEAYGQNELKAGIITIAEGGGLSNKLVSGGSTTDEVPVKGKAIVELAEVGEWNVPTSGTASYKLKNGITNIVINYDENGNVTTVELTQNNKTCHYQKGGVTGEHTYVNGDYYIG